MQSDVNPEIPIGEEEREPLLKRSGSAERAARRDENWKAVAAQRLLFYISLCPTLTTTLVQRWRDLVLRVWHVDPLRCPVCQNPMRVIAIIDDPRVVEMILRHLGAWHDPPARRSLGPGRPPRPPPQGAPGAYTYEPCDDVDPIPDYENVLTD